MHWVSLNFLNLLIFLNSERFAEHVDSPGLISNQLFEVIAMATESSVVVLVQTLDKNLDGENYHMA